MSDRFECSSYIEQVVSPGCYLLLAYSLDGRRRNVVFLVRLQFVEELHVSEQLDGWSPVVVKHSPGAGFRLTLRLNAQHDTHSFHDELH